MGKVERQREIDRRQRRVRKLRALKLRLATTQDSRIRKRLIDKIRRLSPWENLPER